METLMASSSSTPAILCRRQILPVRSSNSFFYTGCCSPGTAAFIRKPLFGNHGGGRKLNHSFKHSSSSSSSSNVKLEIKCGVTEINESQFSDVVLKSDRPVLVEFIATWCGPCRLIAPAIESIAQEYEEKLLVVKIDHDSNPKLIEEYKVYGLPALIVFKDGKEIPESRREGAITKPKLKEYIDALLKSKSWNMLNRSAKSNTSRYTRRRPPPVRNRWRASELKAKTSVPARRCLKSVEISLISLRSPSYMPCKTRSHR